MTLRSAGPQDLEAVMAVERACFGDAGAGDRQAWSRDAWLAELNSAEHDEAEMNATGPNATGTGNPTVTRLVLIDQHEGRTRGVADFGRVIDSCDLDRIMVVPADRRAGLAAELLSHGMSWAARGGAERILLEVNPGNTAAVRLYRHHGFDEISRRENYYGNGEDALVMSASLPGRFSAVTTGAVSNKERHV
jgi:ribosomal protein S18 acetylase RimI-like enzyme